MFRLLDVIQGKPVYELSNGVVLFVADMDIDCDGSGGNPDHDQYFQADTSYHFRGKALNAYEVPFVVVPPVVVQRTRGVVLGCRATVTNLLTGKAAQAVVGDLGPTRKIGEGSPALAKLLGIDPNPNTGGENAFMIAYEIEPGIGASIGGTLYDLQPWRG